MRVAITYNAKPKTVPAGLPDDAFEEFDSPETVEAIGAALKSLGHRPRPLLADASLPAALASDRPELVFNIAEGFRGRCREALVPALCELMGIPYTGSDPLTLCLTLDKAVTKKLLSPEIDTPRWFLLESPADVARVERRFPLMVKPNSEGSSKGVRRTSLVNDDTELKRQVFATFESYGGPVLVEEFIRGPEVTVGVLQGPRVIGLMEIEPRHEPADEFVYSLEIKRDWQRQVQYHVPPRLAPEITEKLSRMAVRAFELLGCRDFARFDFRVDQDGRAFFLECNPLPGLNPESGDIVILSRASGLAYNSLVQRVVESALRRHNLLPR